MQSSSGFVAPPRSPSSSAPSSSEILARNVSNLMSNLPIHSHHRAPLVHELYLRKKMRYFCMFDCPLCFRLDPIPSECRSLPPDDSSGRLKLGIDYSDCKKHQELHFVNAIGTS